MAVRTAYVPVAGEVLTAANLERLPGGWIGYNEVTAAQTSITTVVDLTSLTVTVTVGSTRRVAVSAYAPVAQNVASGLAEVDIYEGAAQLARAYLSLASGAFGVLTPRVVLTPTPGSHTYRLRGLTTGGNMNLNAEAANPAFILVEDVGPAS